MQLTEDSRTQEQFPFATYFPLQAVLFRSFISVHVFSEQNALELPDTDPAISPD
jgi:hypothetical protein